MKKIYTIFVFLFVSQSIGFTSADYLNLSDYDVIRSSKSISAVEKFFKDVNEEYKNSFEKLKIVNLSQNQMTTEIFDTFTNIFKPENFSNLFLIDLTDNLLDEDIAFSLKKWLDNNAQLKISIVKNPISLRHIYKLSRKFTGMIASGQMSKEDKNNFMQRIIFISKDYYKKASEKIQIYKEYILIDALPENWAKIHEEFYNSLEYTKYRDLKKLENLQNIVNDMKLLSISPKRLPTVQEISQGLEN